MEAVQRGSVFEKLSELPSSPMKNVLLNTPLAFTAWDLT